MSYKFTFAVSPRPCKICAFLAFSFFFLLVVSPSNCWAGKKVKLKDVQVLTLRQGEYTTGRRSSPVPQLQCLGGSAGCGNAPSVVQCYNRGSDGHSTQWECKADMSKSQKFGAIEVTCEGYDYPEDEYILAGSCGLEYRLERTGYGGGPSYVHSPYYSSSKSGSFFQNILFLGGAAFVIYVIYRSCLAPPGPDGDPPPYSDDRPPDYPGSPRGGFFGGGGGGGGMPPPPGFRPGYQTDASCGTARGYGYGSAGGGAGLGGGGFWTGAATGGLLGYMFGSRNNPGYQTAYGYPREGTFASSSSFGGSSSSSDTHTSSGFGGTRRR